MAGSLNREKFIEEAKKIHGDLYRYDEFVYVNKKTKGIIYCTKHNIKFEQAPFRHLMGRGCPICRYEKASKSKTHTQEWFLEKVNDKHGDLYDYSKSVYVRSHEKVCIICHKKDKYGVEHGEFWMTPENHLHKTYPQGCPKCARERTVKSCVVNFEEFVERANVIHNNKYSYNKDTFVDMTHKTEITCPIHGPFWQRPTNHTALGHTCPKCSNQVSLAEEEIVDYLHSIDSNLTIECRNRSLLKPLEIDIFVKELNIAIEYNGLVWHSEKFNDDKYSHLYKLKKCNEKGIRLIHIFEDEWLFKKDIVKSRLKSIFGLTENKIYARKCELKSVSPNIAQTFLGQNHIQGKCKGKYHYGLYYDNELVSLMTFGVTRQMEKYNKDYKDTYELLRFCNKQNLNVVGGASKLLKQFIRDVNPKSIISYADRRWSDGNLYNKLGFTHTHNSKPNYFYVVGKKRENRFKYRKSELIKDGYDPSKSEHEIMLDRKIYRIYDCGTMVYKMSLKND